VSRWGPSVDGSLTTLGVVAAGVVALSVLALQSGNTSAAPNTAGAFTDTRGTGTAGTTGTGTTGTSTTVTSGGKAGTQGSAGTSGKPGSLAGGTNAGCNSSNNGGSTDRGVTATDIKLGATIVKSGIGATLLGPVSTGMMAVTDEVNAAGGICGRKLNLAKQLKDDGWDADRGFQFIRNLIEGDKVFALAVNPSSEGLRLASENHYLTKTKTPVIGSDGMLISQYTDPWVWPIAASTISTTHIMAVDACNRLKAKNFAIVFDSKYKFGREGAFAFNAAVKRCTGKDIPGYFNPDAGGGCTDRFCAITAGLPSYDSDNHAFDQACFKLGVSNACDFVAFLLEPNEAVNFLRPGLTSHPAAGLAQTLFTRDFAKRCGAICDGWNVWTGYNPPIEEFAALPAVKQYVATVRHKDPTIDTTNQFLEGGYAGMQLVVEVLRRVGANVTRDRVRQVLDSMNLDSGLTTPLVWRGGSHYANIAMQAFSIQYKGSFNGFRSVTTWVKDPYVGQDQG
jgi:ABC-type branched-subunit amino acid transport system substrate-binding protein